MVKTDICIAPHSKKLTAEELRCGSHSVHTANTPHLPLPAAFHQTALVLCVVTAAICSDYSLLLICRPREDERLSRPSWLNYSGQRFHVYVSVYMRVSVSGVARLEWARVQRFQEGPFVPLIGFFCSANKQSPYSGNFWVGLIVLKFVIQAKVKDFR